MATARTTVLKYYAFRAVTTPGFMWPVSVLYLVSNGVSYATLALGSSAMALLTVLGEVPTGYVGDRLGRRDTIRVAQSLFALYPLTLLYARGPATVVAAYCVLGMAETLQSGAGSAFLYDALDSHDDADRYTHVEGRGTAIRLWVLAATMVAGGLMYAVEPMLPFVASAGMGAAGFLIASTFPASGETPDGDDALRVREAIDVIRSELLTADIRRFIALFAIAAAVGRSARSYFQPIAVDSITPLLSGVAVAGHALPETAVLGVAYASFTVCGALVSDHVSAVESALGPITGVVVAYVLDALAMVAVVVSPLFVLPMMVVHRVVVTVTMPLQKNYVNQRIGSAGRATILSTLSMLGALARAPIGLAAGVGADRFGPALAVGSLGLLLLVATLAVKVGGTGSGSTAENGTVAD
ncbi:MFS transporter [Haloarchaeobius amylolyticus]|uniref:MFS transporter n=1 Tax=Haloarchaeobius amylolyticus TaxID=1198296 RepID=UPI002270CBF2|nr:MFS transporter [Haloarchaeobius amylolyticus]